MDEEQAVIDRRAYMREYMRKRYAENIEKERAYRNSIISKRVNNLSIEDWKKYGIHLADIQKIRKIKQKIPYDLFKLIMDELSELK